jgi:hypothetical protein
MSNRAPGIEEQVKNLILGGVVGGVTHHVIGMLRVEMEKESGRRVPSPHGKELGPLVMLASTFAPEHALKYAAAGFGMGMTIDDVIWHTLEEMKIKPLPINQTGDLDFIEKYSKLYYIDENLSGPEKEALILPIFPRIIEEQRENPMQQTAVRRLKQELHLKPNTMSLMDCYWLQQWFLYWGQYSGNEGLKPGHDRFRTIAKLMRVRDSGTVMKNGHPAFVYDCDCGTTATNQLVDSYGFDTYSMLISQKRRKDEGIYPLHHIFPVVEAKGRLFVLETIKELPIVPIEFVGKLFENITRVVIVPPNGQWYEYTDWQYYMNKRTVHK